MEGKNSSGRRISLLNDSSNSPPPRSPTSSYSSSSIGSPPTPRLMRSDSSDSITMRSPSPVTPEFNFELSDHGPMFAGFFPPQKEMNSGYSLVSQGSVALPYHPANTSQTAYFSPPQMAENLVPAPSPPPANQRSKKNSYPCPMAKQFNCSDYFTTSGHAARHAKKHTGKKDAFCPECNKAFTRKDNMEQHRRTHQSGRHASRPTDTIAKKAKMQGKRPKASPLQSELPAHSSFSMVDPMLPLSPTSGFAIAPAVQPVDSFNSAYPDPTLHALAHSYSSSSYGLDALAIAASGEKRKYEA
jgi:hypothetical protein